MSVVVFVHVSFFSGIWILLVFIRVTFYIFFSNFYRALLDIINGEYTL